MNREKQISVVVPVYNVEAFLPRCIDSILAQIYDNLEIILVDDGAKDASGAICDAYAQKDSRIRVIHKENGGLSSARNAGLEAARGNYVAFVDSDDWIEPEMYGHMLQLMEKYQAKAVCAGRYDIKGATGKRTVGLCPKEETCIPAEEMAGRLFLWDGCDSSACDKLYHRSLFEGFRYPEGKVCEDIPVTFRIMLKAEKVVMCDRPFYNYYHRPNSITTASVSEKTFHFSQHTAEIYPYIREHHPAIEPQARYFRVRSLVNDLLAIDVAGDEAAKTFADQYAASRKELKKHTAFILKSPYFGTKERIRNLLLILGLYRRMRRILKSE